MSESFPMTQTSKLLNDILTKTSAVRAAGKAVLAVYDLDSTLFDVQPRTEKILRDFADLPEAIALDPENAKLLRQIKTEHSDWGIRTAIERAGIHTKNPALVSLARTFWIDKFFSNEYLVYDQPFPGSLSFVQSMVDLGADFIYLTGRAREKMEIGSIEVLRKHGFPLSDNNSELVMKPSTAVEDFKFKEQWFVELPKDKYDMIWFFENEPLNIEKVRVAHPEVQLVFFDSTHSGRVPPPEGIPAIKDFLFEPYSGLASPKHSAKPKK